MDANQHQIPQPILNIARNSRMLSLGELCRVMGYKPEDCVALMDQLVEAGLLRKTTATLREGQVYYWIPPKVVPESGS